MTENINTFNQAVSQSQADFTKKFQEQQQELQRESIDQKLLEQPLEIIGGGLATQGLEGLKKSAGKAISKLGKSVGSETLEGVGESLGSGEGLTKALTKGVVDAGNRTIRQGSKKAIDLIGKSKIPGLNTESKYFGNNQITKPEFDNIDPSEIPNPAFNPQEADDGNILKDTLGLSEDDANRLFQDENQPYYQDSDLSSNLNLDKSVPDNAEDDSDFFSEPKSLGQTFEQTADSVDTDVAETTEATEGAEDGLEGTLAELTADSTVADENPIGDIITAGLGIASVVAPLFENEDNKAKPITNVLNPSFQAGASQ